MGKALEALSNTAMGGAGSALSGAAGAVGGAIGDVLGQGIKDLTGHTRREEERDARNRQQLADEQYKQQGRLNEQAATTNKDIAKYNKELELEMWKDTSYAAQKEQLEKAGLNPALLYGMSGGGGTTTGGGGASGVSGGNASDEASRRQAQIAAEGMALQRRAQVSQINLTNAQAKKENAQADNLKEETTTETEQRAALIEKLTQEGKGEWLENIKRNIEVSNNKETGEGNYQIFGNKLYGKITVPTDNLFKIGIATEIAQAEADAGNKKAQQILTSEQAKGYWTELLNATAHADSDKIKAAAIKLAMEWETGEFTNWKTWVDLGTNTINNLLEGIKGGIDITKSGKPKPIGGFK